MTETDPKKRAPSESLLIDRSARRAVATVVAKAAELHRQTAFIRGRVESGYSTPGQLKVVCKQATELRERALLMLHHFEAELKKLPPSIQSHSRVADIRKSLSRAIEDLERLASPMN